MRCYLAVILLGLCGCAHAVEIQYTCPQTCEAPDPVCTDFHNGIHATPNSLLPGIHAIHETPCTADNLGQSFVQTVDLAPGNWTLQDYSYCDGVYTYSEFTNAVTVPVVLPDPPESFTVQYAGNLAVAGNVVIEQTTVAAKTSGATTTQDITVNMGGITPKTALVKVSRATVAGTPADHAVLGIGATDGTTTAAVGNRLRDGQNATDVYRDSSSSNLVHILDATTAATDGTATFSQFLSTTDTGNSTTGIRIDWSSYPAGAYLLTFVFYGGDDYSGPVGIVTLGNQNVDIDVTAPGLEPDLVEAFSHNATIGSSGAFGNISYGFATNAVQRSISYKSADNQGDDQTGSLLSTNYALGQISISDAANGFDNAIDIHSFDADGFTATARLGNSGGDEFVYIAHSFDDRQVAVGSVDSPTATGDWTGITGLGFTPQYGAIVLSMHTAENVGVESGVGNTIGISSFTANNESSHSIHAQPGAAISDTISLADTDAIDLNTGTGTTDSFDATFSSFNSGSITLNLTGVDGTARKWIYFAVEEAAAGGTDTSLVYNPSPMRVHLTQ